MDSEYNNGRKRSSWPKTAIRLAYTIAQERSEDPYCIVGSVAVLKKDHKVVLGYNGSPAGTNIDWSDRDKRRSYVIHAEANVLNQIDRAEALFLACTHIPCPDCLNLIKHKGIDRVYFEKFTDSKNYDHKFTLELAKQYNIQLIKTDYGDS